MAVIAYMIFLAVGTAIGYFANESKHKDKLLNYYKKKENPETWNSMSFMTSENP